MTLTIKRSDVRTKCHNPRWRLPQISRLETFDLLYMSIKQLHNQKKKTEFHGLRLDIVNWFFIDIIHIICDDLLGTSRELSDSRRNSTFFSFLVYYTRQRLSLHVTFESYSIGFLPFLFSA